MTRKLSSFRIISIFVLVLLTGLVAFPGLKINLYPPGNSRQLNISFFVTGSTPLLTEQKVTSVLESAFSQVTRIKQIRSSSGYSEGLIELEFNPSADLQIKQFEVVSLIRRLSVYLPVNCSYPSVSIASPGLELSNSSFMVYSFVGSREPSEIKKIAESACLNKLSSLKGVKEVTISGAEKSQVVIQFDIVKCQLWHLNPSLIKSAIEGWSKMTYPGVAYSPGNNSYIVEINNSPGDLFKAGNVILSNDKNKLIRLKDIASIYEEQKEPSQYFRINGRHFVNLNISAQENTNEIALAESVRQIIKECSIKLPADINIRKEYDATETISKEINKNYIRALLSLSILGIFMVIVY
ncbi:MAG: efflux RND transporter permease subunit, partial [Bacteroidota bacterium]